MMRKLGLLFACAAAAFAQTTTLPVTVTVSTTTTGAAIPADFLGLSFETGSLTSSTAFPATNTQFQNMVSQLGAGWLRFGGNSVDKTAWARGTRTSTSSSSTLLSSDVDRVLTFARATGWKMLWSVNLESSTASIATDESDYVYTNGKDVLGGLEIGNEPDLYSGNTLVNFETNWKSFADAIVVKNPTLPLTGPADAGNITNWTGPFVNTFSSRLVMTTQHFYPLGPVAASLPYSASISNLLNAYNRGTADSAALSLEDIVLKSGLPWRMSETNSCYDGGYDQVSNVFAASLWGVDYMLTLATRASSGVNFHGGGTGLYTPIAVSTTSGVTSITARPLYYAMLAFAPALSTRIVPVTVNSGRANVDAYAVSDGAGSLRVFVINKDLTFDASVTITPGATCTVANAIRLSAPSLTEETAITLAGASVASDGTWTPQTVETVNNASGAYTLTVPQGTAAIVGFGTAKLGIGNTAGGKTLVAPVSMASLYGTNLAFFTRSTPTVALPTTLAAVTATVTDSAGVARPAPLIYVSPSQVNFVVPQGAASGTATVTVGGASGTVSVNTVAPGLFALGATTVAAATAERYAASGADLGAVTVFDCSSGTCKVSPISVDSSTNVFLTLYGTGIRGATGNVTCTVGGASVPVQYAGPQGSYTAFDQVNIQLPASLRGAGTVNVILTADGQTSNTVQIAIAN